MEFKNILLNLRKERNINQKELAKLLNVSQPVISYLESGRNEPDNITLVKLAEHFNVTTDYLLGRTNLKLPQTEYEFLNKMDKLDVDELMDEYDFTFKGITVNKKVLEAFINLIKVLKEEIKSN